MWLPQAISENVRGAAVFAAEVESADGVRLGLAGKQGIGRQFMPYGLESVPPKGELAAAADTGRAVCVLGVESQGRLELEPGEIGLFSQGGASIILKNDGTVLINGRVFE